MPSRKYTPEQENVLLAFLPGFVATEPNTRERKLWKAKLDVEWLTQWDMKPEHSGMFSTWFRNHREELLRRQAQASTGTQSASIDAVTALATASVEDARSTSQTQSDSVLPSGLEAVPARATASAADAHAAPFTQCKNSSPDERHELGRVTIPGLGGVPKVVLETEVPGIRAREAVVELQGTRLSVYASSVLTDRPYQWSTDVGRAVAAGGLRCGMRLGRMCLLVPLEDAIGDGVEVASEKSAVSVEAFWPWE